MGQQQFSCHGEVLTDKTKLELLVTERNLGTLSFSLILGEIGKDIEFSVPCGTGFQSVSLEPYRMSPCVCLGYTSLWSFTYSDIPGFASLGSSVTTERPFCLLKITRHVTSSRTRRQLEGLRVESPESGSGPDSLGCRDLFSVYQGINYGFHTGLPGHQRGWLKKAEALSLGFFQPWSVIFSRKMKGCDFSFTASQSIIEVPVTHLILVFYPNINTPDLQQLRGGASILSFLVNVRVNSQCLINHIIL